MANFTKGPWTLGDENNASAEVVLGTEHNLTCSFNRQDSNTGEYVISREEMLANVHLTMAAPDMYDAIKGLQGLLQLIAYRFSPVDMTIITNNHRWIEAERVLAAAEGRQA